MLRRIATTGAFVAATMLFGATHAGAAADTAEPYPSDVREAVARLAATGHLSPADRSTITAHPEVAGAVLDPDAVTMTTRIRPAAGSTAEAGTQGGPGCWIGNHTVTGRYASGGVAYKYTYRVDWCETSTVVKNPHYRNHTVELSTFMRQRGIIENWVTPAPQTKVETKRKIEIENCPPVIGCWRSEFPWVTWTLRAGHISGDYANGGIDG